MNTFRFIFAYIKRHRFQYIAGIITLFVVDFVNIFIPQEIGKVTDGLESHSLSWNGVKQSLFLICLLGLILTIGRFLWRYFIFGAARVIEKELRNEMFGHLEKMSVEYYNEHKTGDLMTRFTSDLNAVRMAIGPAVISAFDASVMTVMVIFQMMYYVNVELTLLAIIPMLFICFGEIYYGKIIYKRFKARQEAVSNLTDFVQESFSGVRVIKAFVRERSELKAFTKANKATMEKNLDIVRLQSIVMPLLDVVIGASTLITLVYGGYLVLYGKITLGRFVAFHQYINMLVWPMLACGESIQMFSQGGASVRRIKEVFEEKPEIFDSDTTEEIEKMEGNIVLSHLTFIHKGHTEPTLKDINLTIPAGTTLAVIGRTGNGKSTLVNLLLRLYNTKPGMILIDGRDINTIALKTLRENIAYVPQDNFLFSGTIKDNIRYGKLNATDEEIIAAAKAVNAHDFIMKLEKGYDTEISERGVRLSIGQRQLLAFARTMVSEPRILILDEATSSIDTHTEILVQQGIEELLKGRTSFVIAHRLSTIKKADKIFVVDKGKICEAGNHEELMERKGAYYELYQAQFRSIA